MVTRAQCRPRFPAGQTVVVTPFVHPAIIAPNISLDFGGIIVATTTTEIDRDTLLWMFKTMVTIRCFEEQSKREADAGRLRGMHSSIGQEAVPVGVCAHLRDDDYVLGTHRSHHHCIAKGLDLKQMMAELLGKSTGTNKGKGGTMHIADIDKGMLGANGVVGSNIPVATGVGLSAKVRGTDQVSVVFFGDGAANQGTLHEAMNLAGIWKLPVIFVCENNRYAESTPVEYSVAGESIAGTGRRVRHAEHHCRRAIGAGDVRDRRRSGRPRPRR